MSIQDNATYGHIKCVGLGDKLYLLQCWNKWYMDLSKEDQKKYLPYQLHSMAIDKNEAIHLYNNLALWLSKKFNMNVLDIPK